MKKLLSLAMVLALALSLLSGCGCAKQKEPANSAAPAASVAPAEGEQTPAEESGTVSESEPNPDKPAVSENKEVVTKEQAPKIFMIKNPDSNTDSLTYHLENCTVGEGKEMQEVSWDMVKAIGFWQCPTCNPPRYEDYKNAE